ncbi:DUF4157 domain-containing protein [Bradyrhizobium diazoefficiens]|uniref:eCIS core domain-containing protein n=1 Tax=Bradyrhizobium diazoefficiens TaxID=1355477 RepID=UPI0004AE93CC|nr:DUF4157 domain-containing protein [Bradyrhizobium diazoefficiens]
MGSARIAETHKSALDRSPAAAFAARAPLRAPATPSSTGALQSRIGNRAVLALARSAEGPAPTSVGPSLRISSPGDPAEREAVRVAAQVTRSVDGAPGIAPAAAAIQRAGALPSSPANGGSPAPASVAARIASSMSGGTALPTTVRAQMEPRFGANFGSVRIHTNEKAANLSGRLNARAFTVGNHVFFGRGQFQPDRRDGRELIAHELTHTIQQGGVAQRSIQRDLIDDAKGALGAVSDWVAEQGGLEAVVRAALTAVAPGLASMIGPGGLLQALAAFAMKAVEGLFDSLKQPLAGILGAGEQIAQALAPIIETIQAAAVQIAKNDCTPIRLAAEKIEQIAMRLITPVIELVQPVIAGIKRFLDEAWKKVGAPILDWIREYAAEQWRMIKEIADLVQRAAKWLWDKTAGLREPYIQMWNLLKNILGLGDSPEGQNGILQWVEQKLTAAWESIKARLQPYTEQLKAIGIAVGAVLLALSPAGPILALGAAAIEVSKGIAWVAANWGKGNIIATARTFVEKTLLPPLVAALDKVSATVANIANSISTSLAALAATLAKSVAVAGGTAIGVIVRLTQWLSEQAQALAAFVNTKLGELKLWLGGAFDKLVAFLKKVMNFLSRVGDVIIDIYGLPVLLGEAVWNAVPQCIRDPIVDFLGPIILRQIELFSELVKDDEAWKKTKEEVGRLIKLVFHNKDLIGAVKAAFFFVLRVFNLPPELLATVGTKALAAWDLVAKNPLQFVKTTLKAIAQGFKIIWDDKLENIKNGLQGWLLGEIKDKNIIMPTNWTDLGQIFEFVLSVLGISVEHTYELLKKRFPPEKVERFRAIVGTVQRVLEWVDRSIVVTRSPKDNAAGMLNQARNFGLTLLEAGAEWIIKKVAAKVTEEIVKAAATAGLGSILSAAQSLYAALLTAKKWMRQILEMANKALDSIIDLVAGAVGKVGGVFAELMKKAMPVVVGFLADQVGLGDVGRELGKAIDKLRADVDKAILWVIDRIKAGIELLIGAGKGVVAKIKAWWAERVAFKGKDGEPHSVYVVGDEYPEKVMVATTPSEIAAKLKAIVAEDGDLAKKAQRALEYYDQEVKPAIGKDKKEVKDFGRKFTQLSNLLAEVFDTDKDDLPDKAVWLPRGGGRSSVQFLSTRTSQGGTRATGSPPGWDMIVHGGLSESPARWVRMHLITAGVGGEGLSDNLVPAPSSVNSGAQVRGFELRLEQLVKNKSGKGRQKNNLVWVNAKTKFWGPGNGPGKTRYGADTFASAVDFEAGRYVPNAKKEADKTKNWDKVSAAELFTSVTVPQPEFGKIVPNINDMSIEQLVTVIGVSSYYAMQIRRISADRRFIHLTDFWIRMNKEVRDNERFNDMYAKVRDAVNVDKTVRF